uniref:Uncharacterized protein n=1 Tax=Aegilops tauschii TaxID=37682 RepID=R7WFX3_AEGTA
MGSGGLQRNAPKIYWEAIPSNGPSFIDIITELEVSGSRSGANMKILWRQGKKKKQSRQ